MSNSITDIPQITVSQSQKEIVINTNFGMTSPAMNFGLESVIGLTWTYRGGTILIGGTPTQITGGTITLTDNATNYIRVSTAGVVDKVTSAPSGWPGPVTGYTALYEVATVSGLSTWTDYRCGTTGSAGATGATGAGATGATGATGSTGATGATGSGGSGATVYWDPRSPPASPNALDEEWNDGTGMSGTINGLDSSWTAFGASQTRVYSYGRAVTTGTASGGTSPNISGLAKTAPGGSYTVTTVALPITRSAYNGVYLGVRRASTGKMLVNRIDFEGTTKVQWEEYNSTTSRASNNAATTVADAVEVFLRIVVTSTQWSAYYSNTGIAGTYVQIGATQTLSTFFSASLPDQYFVGLDAWGTFTPVSIIGAVRVT